MDPAAQGSQLAFTDVAEFGDALIAVAIRSDGGDDFESALLRSADGREWALEPSAGLDAYVPTSIATSEVGLVVTSHRFGVGDGSVFFSPDAAEWVERQTSGGPAGMLDVLEYQGEFVAVGYRYLEGVERPVVWRSSDGLTWVDAGAPSAPERTTLWAVAEASDGALVVLASTAAIVDEPCSAASPCPPDTIGAWYSTDEGATWSQGDLAGNAAAASVVHYDFSLVAYRGALAAVAWTETGPAAWISPGGASWEGSQLPAAAAGGEVTAAGSNGEVILIFVATPEGQLTLRGAPAPGP